LIVIQLWPVISNVYTDDDTPVTVTLAPGAAM
jgi:hypothetical protein